jgi:chromosome partitioning protein
MKIYTFTSIKGGVLKTTNTANIALGLAQTGRRTLVIDADHQSNCTYALTGSITDQREDTFYEVMMNRRPVKQVIKPTRFANLDLVAGSLWLSNANTALAGLYGRENILRQALSSVTDYHYVLIDTAPNTELITTNAWVASDSLVVALTPSLFAMIGIRILEIHLEEIRRQTQRPYPLFGVIIGKAEPTRIASTRIGEIREYFGDKVFKTVIPKNVKVEEAMDEATAIYDFAPESAGARAYADLVQEFIARSEGPEHG